MIRSAPASTATPGSHVSRPAAIVISAALTSSRPPRCSRNSTAASTTVAASSVLSRIEAVAALVRASPATSSAGPTAPPASTATAAGRHSAISARRVGGRVSTDGSTASAAPTYSRPANVNDGIEPASSEAAGAVAPNSTAASRQRTTPVRFTPPVCQVRSARLGARRRQPPGLGWLRRRRSSGCGAHIYAGRMGGALTGMTGPCRPGSTIAASTVAVVAG